MSIFASALRAAYKLSGAKKAFGLPEDELKKVIEKQSRSRGVFTPTDRKAYYETIHVNGFPCLIVRENEKPSKSGISPNRSSRNGSRCFRSLISPARSAGAGFAAGDGEMRRVK